MKNHNIIQEIDMTGLITVFMSIILSIFSTAVMGYIAMAVPIGPWIAPTLVLIAMLFFKLLSRSFFNRSVALVTISGSVGGILATAVGFSFPTLCFLDQPLFNSWMASRLYFSLVLMGLSLAAGGFGFFIANVFEKKLLVQEKLAFPIGQLVHKMIAVGNNITKACELIVGFIATLLFCGAQRAGGLIPKTIILLQQISFGVVTVPAIRFDLWPMVWAIGFITGYLIAIPLAVGAVSKIILVDPLHQLFYANLSSIEFVFAFCSGMIIYSTACSFMGLKRIMPKKMPSFSISAVKKSNYVWIKKMSHARIAESGVLLGCALIFLTYFKFSFLAQLFLLTTTFIFTYQVLVIAGKIGLAPFPRFATFVMIPAMFLFQLSSAQIVLLSTFVQISAGVAVDVLFGRKIAQLGSINAVTVKRYQYLGLLVSALSVGIIFWLLIDGCQLGSAQLFAYKAKSRQLLISTLLNGSNFNIVVLLIGCVFSFIVQKLRVNPMLVLGGLLMPLNLSLGLIFGGMLALCTKKRQDWDPFWSGVFAANSIWMLWQAL